MTLPADVQATLAEMKAEAIAHTGRWDAATKPDAATLSQRVIEGWDLVLSHAERDQSAAHRAKPLPVGGTFFTLSGVSSCGTGEHSDLRQIAEMSAALGGPRRPTMRRPTHDGKEQFVFDWRDGPPPPPPPRTLSDDGLAALARLRAFAEDPNNWGDGTQGVPPPMLPGNEAKLADWYVTMGWMIPPSGAVMRHMSVQRLADRRRAPEPAVVDEIGLELGFGIDAERLLRPRPDGAEVCVSIVEETGAHHVGKAAGRDDGAEPKADQSAPFVLPAADIAALARLRAFAEDPNRWVDGPTDPGLTDIPPPPSAEYDAALSGWSCTFCWSIWPPQAGSAARTVMRVLTVRNAVPASAPDLAAVREIARELGFGPLAPREDARLPDGSLCMAVFEDTGSRLAGKAAIEGAAALARALNERLGKGESLDAALAGLGVAVRRDGEPMRAAAVPGRNDPCPCGSGKKYKKCHGRPS